MQYLRNNGLKHEQTLETRGGVRNLGVAWKNNKTQLPSPTGLSGSSHPQYVVTKSDSVHANDHQYNFRWKYEKVDLITRLFLQFRTVRHLDDEWTQGGAWKANAQLVAMVRREAAKMVLESAVQGKLRDEFYCVNRYDIDAIYRETPACVHVKQGNRSLTRPAWIPKAP